MERPCWPALATPIFQSLVRGMAGQRRSRRDDGRRRRSRPVTRRCQHQEVKGGPVCGIEFEPAPRIGGSGHNTGVHPNQRYCPAHQTDQARGRPRWNNTPDERRKAIYRSYRARNLEMIRAKQRATLKLKRAKIAETVAKAERILLGEIPSQATAQRQRGHPKGARESTSRKPPCSVPIGARHSFSTGGN